MNTAMLRGLEQAVAELYAKVARGSGGLGLVTGFVSVKEYGAKGTGTVDESAAFQRGIAAVAGTGIALWIPAGTYRFDAPAGAPVGQSMPSNVTIWGSPGARLVNNQTFTGEQTHCIFYAKATLAGNSGTLAAGPTLGVPSLSVNMTTAPTAGHFLAVSEDLSQQTFFIRAVTGSGPYTVTLDRPVIVPFANGSPVTELSSVPTGIHLRMNGSTCSGTGDRIAELLTALRCSVDDFHYDTLAGAIGDFAFSFDIGGYQSGFSNCSVDGAGATGDMAGLTIESGEDCWIFNCVANNTPYIGIVIFDGIACNVIGCRTSGNAGYGFALGTDASLGSFDCNMIGCTSYDDVYGLVLNGSSNARFVGCSFKYATNTGILFNATGIDATDFTACAVDGSANGFNGGNGNTSTRVRGMSFSGCTMLCLTTASDFDGEQLEAINLTVTMNALSFTGGSYARLRGLNLVHSGIVNAVNFSGVARGEIDGAQVSMGASSAAVQLAAASVGVIRCVTTAGSATGTTGVLVNAGCTARLGIGNSLSSVATAVSVAGGGFTNRFVQVLAGAATTTVAWPNLKTTDNVQLQVQSKNAGTLEGPYGITPTPGTGFTITPLGTTPALDVSTLEVFIG